MKISFRTVNIAKNAETQTVTLTFPQEISAKTTATLHIEYTGILDDKMLGFYRSSYKDQDGKTRYISKCNSYL